MKRVLVIFFVMTIMLSGCGSSAEKRIFNDNNDIIQNQNDSVEKINSDFQQIMTIGTDLISELSNMPSNDEYKSLVKADGYVKEMKRYYAEMIDLCGENEELAGMSFQLEVLDHSCPNPIGGKDVTSINNQKILYQLHLKQLSSSFSYLSEYMNYLAGNKTKPTGVAYFKEVSDIPTPDTVMYEIQYDSEKIDSGVKQYMYLIGDTEIDANMNYNAYIVALGTIDELSVDITSNAVYVKKNGTMVSAMMAGTDPQKGRFMIVSFQE